MSLPASSQTRPARGATLIARRAEDEDVDDKVVALQTFGRGGVLTAMCVIAEIGDPRRFRNAEQVASYCGLVPSEHPSGERVRRGSFRGRPAVPPP